FYPTAPPWPGIDVTIGSGVDVAQFELLDRFGCGVARVGDRWGGRDRPKAADFPAVVADIYISVGLVHGHAAGLTESGQFTQHFPAVGINAYGIPVGGHVQRPLEGAVAAVDRHLSFGAEAQFLARERVAARRGGEVVGSSIRLPAAHLVVFRLSHID